MNSKIASPVTWLLAAVSVLTFGLPGAARAQTAEKARLPYSVLYHLAHPQQLKGPFAGVSQTICVTSVDPEVKAAAIDMVIEARSGRVSIQLKDDGTFVLPEKPEWLEQDPPVVTNQPKGSMQLRVRFRDEITFKGGAYPYSELISPLLWLRAITSEMALSTGEHRNPAYTTVLFKLASVDATATIEFKDGDTKPIILKANDRGFCCLEWNPAFLRENPTVRFPAGDIICAGVAE